MLFHEWCYHVISTDWVIISNELLTGCHPASAKMFSMWEWYREKWLLHYTFIWASLLICSPVLITHLYPLLSCFVFLLIFYLCIYLFFACVNWRNTHFQQAQQHKSPPLMQVILILSLSSGPIKQGRVSSLQSQPFGLHCSCRRDGGCARTCMFSLSKAGAPPG